MTAAPKTPFQMMHSDTLTIIIILYILGHLEVAIAELDPESFIQHIFTVCVHYVPSSVLGHMYAKRDSAGHGLCSLGLLSLKHHITQIILPN